MFGVAAYLASGPYRVARLARSVRLLASEGRYQEAREPLERWLKERPRSAEAIYYKARLELAAERPAEALAALEEARRLGFDRDLLWSLAAVMQARSGRFAEAEPGLVRAYRLKLEPQADVAMELARVYLSTYRLSQAAEPVERWRALAPEDPRPYLWRNEIASRSDALPGTLIENYRAALERDPNLDEVRLRLADQLAKQSRFAEADEEYATCLRRNPKDTVALVGLGRGALRRGDVEAATRHFEAALAADPRQPEALKELAQIDLRRGRHKDACARLAILTEVEPFDADIRYSFAQALRLVGDDARSRVEGERAARLRRDNDRIDELRKVLLRQPGDVNTRYEVARWMLEHGHQSEGLEWAALILRAEPGHAPTHRLLADYYEKKGNPGLANFYRSQSSGAEREVGRRPHE
jgi:tetratricopeptide (TPR) repeat protein